jgi:retron-type reverse transcriptase
MQLAKAIYERKYTPKPCIAFIIHKPVMREIFAADFRDRVIHHFIYNYISPVFEKIFINDCYSCRVGKGTHYGIKRMNHFILSCSQNYTKDCYILKLDIKGYFMSINKNQLFKLVKEELLRQSLKIGFDLHLVLYLVKETIFNDPRENCIIKGKKTDWAGLPQTKSLFFAKANCGLPIGNLTSQLFGNIYLNKFDHWVKHNLKIKHYGRYVDDFVLIHENKDYLQSCIQQISNYLKETIALKLHPDKIYFQHYSKGLKYIGAVIKPHRIYIANRTKSNLHIAVNKQNLLARSHKPDIEEQQAFQSSMNSYLGIMKHYKTYKLRKEMIFENLSGWWLNYVYSFRLEKFVIKRKIHKQYYPLS